ncbi:MAG: magnesium chelatase subunit H [Myxococcota bacterium]
MPKRTTAAEPTPIRVVIITLDSHIAQAVERARCELASELPGLSLRFHAATDWSDDPESLAACKEDIASGDIVFANMLFMEDHIKAVLPELAARRENCDAMIGAMSAGEVIRLTRIGGFRMDGEQKGPLALLKRLRGNKKNQTSSGANQMKMLRRIPKILRFIPGKAQDVRAYFLTLQYWLAGSDTNIANLVRFLINRYASGDRASLNGALDAKAPIDYPDVGLYHPRLPERIVSSLEDLPTLEASEHVATVGVLVMRSYVLSGDTEHYDAVLRALEQRGLRPICAFASGLDARPAVEAFFMKDGRCTVDAVLSLTGFSLVGGPAFNDACAAEKMLAQLDVPYLSAQGIEFQSVEQWSSSARGLLPVESTIMVAIPELDGATGPMVFAGRPQSDGDVISPAMKPIDDRIEMLANRLLRLAKLRTTPASDRNIAIVLFNFPPNGGAVGTAAHLAVFASLYNTLRGLAQAGYDVEVPESVDALRTKLLEGNAHQYGTDANVHTKIGVDDHVRRETWLADLEAQWGPAPGRQQSDGAGIFVLGAQFGRVFVGIQPAFGYEGDPMRLLFESGFAPTHAFSAFYRYLREDFEAHAVLHFGTHGALEFMPGKQVGLSSACWPDRLIQDLPNFYLYAANNPSEGTIAKRRSAATLISYLTPPLARAGLYRGLIDLRESLDRWRALPPEQIDERERLLPVIQAQARELDFLSTEGALNEDLVYKWAAELAEYEQTLIPQSLHAIGEPPTIEARADHLAAVADAAIDAPVEDAVKALVAGKTPKAALRVGKLPTTPQNIELFEQLRHTNEQMSEDHELPALLRALDGGFIRPAPGGDLLRNPEVLPTGRNIHGFDPFRIPSAFAVADGARQAERILARHLLDGHALPRSMAVVLWGTDNLKTEGGPIGQVLALIGARPRFDSYGRIAGAQLIPLEELGRPRIDVVVTLSGIFRDLLPLQTRLLAEASYLAAIADEPTDQNYIRLNALAYQQKHGCDLETAALRVFSNADGAYGSNVNQLIDSGAWTDEDDLAETYERRKCYAYGRSGRPVRQQELLQSALSNVQLTYQNLESVELGVTTIDHYFDTLGGIGRAVRRAQGGDEVPVYIGDQTRGDGVVRTLGEQVNLESRTRVLNPKWYEGMLKHGPEGVRQIEAHITNTMGWSATTGQVAPWVYKQLSQTFVLDPEMRRRLAELNPKASAKLANRLLEAHERDYWQPDESTLEALRQAGDELEDRLEGITEIVAA